MTIYQAPSVQQLEVYILLEKRMLICGFNFNMAVFSCRPQTVETEHDDLKMMPCIQSQENAFELYRL